MFHIILIIAINSIAWCHLVNYRLFSFFMLLTFVGGSRECVENPSSFLVFFSCRQFQPPFQREMRQIEDRWRATFRRSRICCERRKKCMRNSISHPERSCRERERVKNLCNYSWQLPNNISTVPENLKNYCFYTLFAIYIYFSLNPLGCELATSTFNVVKNLESSWKACVTREPKEKIPFFISLCPSLFFSQKWGRISCMQRRRRLENDIKFERERRRWAVAAAEKLKH